MLNNKRKYINLENHEIFCKYSLIKMKLFTIFSITKIDKMYIIFKHQKINATSLFSQNFNNVVNSLIHCVEKIELNKEKIIININHSCIFFT